MFRTAEILHLNAALYAEAGPRCLARDTQFPPVPRRSSPPQPQAGPPAQVEADEAREVKGPGGLGAGGSAAGQEAQGTFLFEVEGAARGGGDAAEAAAEVRDGGPDRRLGQHPQAERQ